mmetsp:Transcript_47401/g.138225  ORF Transcript_47401/g.138225 Transcript_47401/m.138225 type:complete len:225 (-) Transcript_47401:1121-1795(-)
MGHGGLRWLPGLLRPRPGGPVRAAVVGASALAHGGGEVPRGVCREDPHAQRGAMRLRDPRDRRHAPGRHRHRLDEGCFRRRLVGQQRRRHLHRSPGPVRLVQDVHGRDQRVRGGPADAELAGARPQRRGPPRGRHRRRLDGRGQKEHVLLRARPGRPPLAHFVRRGPGGSEGAAGCLWPCGLRGQRQHLAAEERGGRAADDPGGRPEPSHIREPPDASRGVGGA